MPWPGRSSAAPTLSGTACSPNISCAALPGCGCATTSTPTRGWTGTTPWPVAPPSSGYRPGWWSAARRPPTCTASNTPRASPTMTCTSSCPDRCGSAHSVGLRVHVNAITPLPTAEMATIGRPRTTAPRTPAADPQPSAIGAARSPAPDASARPATERALAHQLGMSPVDATAARHLPARARRDTSARRAGRRTAGPDTASWSPDGRAGGAGGHVPAQTGPRRPRIPRIRPGAGRLGDGGLARPDPGGRHRRLAARAGADRSRRPWPQWLPATPTGRVRGGQAGCSTWPTAEPQSPPESQLRVRLVLGGLPRPVVQHPVRLATRHCPAPRPGVAGVSGRGRVRRKVALRRRAAAPGPPSAQPAGRRGLAGPARDRAAGCTAEFPAVLREVRDALVSRGWRR